MRVRRVRTKSRRRVWYPEIVTTECCGCLSIGSVLSRGRPLRARGYVRRRGNGQRRWGCRLRRRLQCCELGHEQSRPRRIWRNRGDCGGSQPDALVRKGGNGAPQRCTGLRGLCMMMSKRQHAARPQQPALSMRRVQCGYNTLLAAAPADVTAVAGPGMTPPSRPLANAAKNLKWLSARNLAASHAPDWPREAASRASTKRG